MRAFDALGTRSDWITMRMSDRNDEQQQRRHRESACALRALVDEVVGPPGFANDEQPKHQRADEREHRDELEPSNGLRGARLWWFCLDDPSIRGTAQLGVGGAGDHWRRWRASDDEVEPAGGCVSVGGGGPPHHGVLPDPHRRGDERADSRRLTGDRLGRAKGNRRTGRIEQRDGGEASLGRLGEPELDGGRGHVDPSVGRRNASNELGVGKEQHRSDQHRQRREASHQHASSKEFLHAHRLVASRGHCKRTTLVRVASMWLNCLAWIAIPRLRSLRSRSLRMTRTGSSPQFESFPQFESLPQFE